MKLFLIIFLVLTVYADSNFDVIPNVKIDNMDKYNLGKRLFHDKNLSRDKTTSCASCHDLNLYGTDNHEVYLGVENIKGKLNSPTIYNARFNIAQDGSGRASTIKERAKFSFLNKSEMAGDIKEVIKYIHSDILFYNEFVDVYGYVSEDSVFDSISYFVENLLTPNAKFDKFLKGDKAALNKDELKGYHLFKKYGCISCHNGRNIGGNMYQKFGIFSEFDHHEGEDDEIKGRYDVTKNQYDKNVFKVPSLRNIVKTSPYLHDGSISDLQTMIKKMGKHQLGIDIPADDIKFIELFLITLTGELENE